MFLKQYALASWRKLKKKKLKLRHQNGWRSHINRIREHVTRNCKLANPLSMALVINLYTPVVIPISKSDKPCNDLTLYWGQTSIWFCAVGPQLNQGLVAYGEEYLIRWETNWRDRFVTVIWRLIDIKEAWWIDD